jgi:hypothetical protein
MYESFKTPWLQIFKDFVEMEFRELARYAAAIERLLSEEGARFSSQLSEQTRNMTEQQRHDYYESATDEFHNLERTFPRILRYSLFVQSYALFEDAVARVAEHYRDELALELSPSELKDKGIIRTKTYLKKVARKPFPDTMPEWQDILILNQIRNSIVHETGYFSEEKQLRQDIQSFIQKWADAVSFDNMSRFDITSQFTERALKTFTGFLDTLFANLLPSK